MKVQWEVEAALRQRQGDGTRDEEEVVLTGPCAGGEGVRLFQGLGYRES